MVRAIPREGRVVLEGVNVAKRHAKPTRATMQGGIIDKFMPVPVLGRRSCACGSGEPTRIGMTVDEKGRRCGSAGSAGPTCEHDDAAPGPA